jgi:hypothetical protein
MIYLQFSYGIIRASFHRTAAFLLGTMTIYLFKTIKNQLLPVVERFILKTCKNRIPLINSIFLKAAREQPGLVLEFMRWRSRLNPKFAKSTKYFSLRLQLMLMRLAFSKTIKEKYL